MALGQDPQHLPRALHGEDRWWPTPAPEELEAENSGVSIPADVGWLCRAKAQTRF